MRKDDKLIFCMPRKGDIWVMLNQRCGAVSAVCTLLECYKEIIRGPKSGREIEKWNVSCVKAS
jgi:hypothetical protein